MRLQARPLWPGTTRGLELASPTAEPLLGELARDRGTMIRRMAVSLVVALLALSSGACARAPRVPSAPAPGTSDVRATPYKPLSGGNGVLATPDYTEVALSDALAKARSLGITLPPDSVAGPVGRAFTQRRLQANNIVLEFPRQVELSYADPSGVDVLRSAEATNYGGMAPFTDGRKKPFRLITVNRTTLVISDAGAQILGGERIPFRAGVSWQQGSATLALRSDEATAGELLVIAASMVR